MDHQVLGLKLPQDASTNAKGSFTCSAISRPETSPRARRNFTTSDSTSLSVCPAFWNETGSTGVNAGQLGIVENPHPPGSACAQKAPTAERPRLSIHGAFMRVRPHAEEKNSTVLRQV